MAATVVGMHIMGVLTPLPGLTVIMNPSSRKILQVVDGVGAMPQNFQFLVD